MTAARASVSACLMRGSVSFASAASSAGSALCSRDLNTACADSKRLAGIGRLQAQAAERGIERAPHPVVDAHVGEIGRLGAVRRRAGRGVDQLAGLVLVEDLLLLGAVGQPAVLQRLDDGDGARIAGRRDLGDAGVGLAEIVLEEMRQRAGKAGQSGEPGARGLGAAAVRIGGRRGLRRNGRCRRDQRKAKEKRIATRRSGKTRIAVFSRRLILGRRR